MVRERLPDAVLDGADEVELIDLSPRALRQRIEHGHVYPAGRAAAALEGFFREGNLTALRELALRRTAQQVDAQLQAYMTGHGIDASWPASERVLVCVDHQPLSKQLVRRAWRLASRLRAELLAGYVEPPDWDQLPFQVQKAVEANLRFAEDLGARVVRRPAGRGEYGERGFGRGAALPGCRHGRPGRRLPAGSSGPGRGRGAPALYHVSAGMDSPLPTAACVRRPRGAAPALPATGP